MRDAVCHLPYPVLVKKKLDSFADPEDLGSTGRAFWDVTVSKHELSDSQIVLLFEVCKFKDQIAAFDVRLAGLDPIETADEETKGMVEWALGRRSALSTLMAKHLAQLRLGQAAATGVGNPGGARGSYVQNKPPKRTASELRSRLRSTG